MKSNKSFILSVTSFLSIASFAQATDQDLEQALNESRLARQNQQDREAEELARALQASRIEHDQAQLQASIFASISPAHVDLGLGNNNGVRDIEAENIQRVIAESARVAEDEIIQRQQKEEEMAVTFGSVVTHFVEERARKEEAERQLAAQRALMAQQEAEFKAALAIDRRKEEIRERLEELEAFAISLELPAIVSQPSASEIEALRAQAENDKARAERFNSQNPTLNARAAESQAKFKEAEEKAATVAESQKQLAATRAEQAALQQEFAELGKRN